jgi:hypothetical protein
MTRADPMVTLHPDEADDVYNVLAILEDWLLGAGDSVRADLADFAGWTRDGDPEPTTVSAFLARLGDAGILLGRALRTLGHDGQVTG